MLREIDEMKVGLAFSIRSCLSHSRIGVKREKKGKS